MKIAQNLPLISCLLAFLLLPGCWMGDKYYEEVNCPLEGNEYVVRFGDENAVPALHIPRHYKPACSTQARAGDRGLIEASLFVKYPSLQPAEARHVEDMREGDVYLRISRNYGASPTPDDVSTGINDYVAANAAYKDAQGQSHFAPVEPLGRGLSVQHGISEGSGDVYFERDPATGQASSLTLCGISGRCEGNGVTRDGAYHFSYSAKGIGSQEFSILYARMQGFVENLYNGNAFKP